MSGASRLPLLDGRSLALARIVVALVLIRDWAERFRDIPAFWSDDGLFPLWAGLDRGGDVWHFSLLDAVSSTPMVRLAFLLGLAAYLCLLAGWRAGPAAWASWLFFLSVVNRDILVRHGGDCALIVLLPWAACLPLGRRFSLDARLRPCHAVAPPRPWHGAAAVLLVGQLALIYLSTAFAKCGGKWYDGTALYYAWNLDSFASPLGVWLAAHLPLPLVRLLTWASLGWEWALPLALAAAVVWGRRSPWPGRAALALSAALLGGIALTMAVGDFPFVLFAFTLVLVPAADWARLARRFPFLAAPPDDAPKPAPRLAAAAVFVLFALAAAAALMNAYNFNFTERWGWKEVRMPRLLQAFVLIPQGLQNWKMFAANPVAADGWYVFDGLLEDGTRMDPWTGAPVDYAKHPGLARRHGRFWMKIYERLWQPEYAPYRVYWARYVARRFDEGKPPGRRLRSFRIVYVQEEIPPPGVVAAPPRPIPIWDHDCAVPLIR